MNESSAEMDGIVGMCVFVCMHIFWGEQLDVAGVVWCGEIKGVLSAVCGVVCM